MEPGQDAGLLGEQVRAVAGYFPELGERRGDLGLGGLAPRGMPHGNAGDPGDEQPVTVRSGTIASHSARIEHGDDKDKNARAISCIFPEMHGTQRQIVSTGSYRLLVDIGVIVYTAELEAPALRETARRILEAEAVRFGVPLGREEVLRHRARDGSAMHVMAAADELVRHLAAEPDPLGEDSPLMVLARAGALALVSRVEAAGSSAPASA
jgi:hypothetical protein